MTTRLQGGDISFDPPNVTVHACRERTLAEWFTEVYKLAVDLIQTGRTESSGQWTMWRPPDRKQTKGYGRYHQSWEALGRVLDDYAKQYMATHPNEEKRSHDERVHHIIRDAFLEGRDDDAIDILLTEFVRISMPADVMERLNIHYEKTADGKRQITYLKRTDFTAAREEER